MPIILKVLILWAAILPMAIFNGALRENYLVSWIGAKQAHAVSGLLLSLIVLVFSTVTMEWLGISTVAGYFEVGGAWLVLTILFEFLFGHYVVKKSWTDLWRPYTFHDGELWPVVLVVITMAPFLGAKFSGLI